MFSAMNRINIQCLVVIVTSNASRFSHFQNTFYWPENARDGQKLNVNGDPSIDMWDDSGNQKSNDMHSQTRELRQFSRNFVLDTKESNNKRSPDSDSNISDAVKNERRKWSTRA